MDLKLNGSHDLAIENDDLVIVDGLDAIAQDCDVRLQFFQGEWFLDSRLGVPYFEEILGQKEPRLVAVKGILRSVILSTPGILSLQDFDLTLDRASRVLTVEFRAITVEGPFEYNKELII